MKLLLSSRIRTRARVFCATFLFVAVIGGTACASGPILIPPAVVTDYTEIFNKYDDELYPQLITNAQAADFLAKNIPRFACPDPDLERTWYFRWWVFRKHLRATADGGHVITEFLAPVPHAGPENSISCPVGHHFREARWLRDQIYLNDTARFWFLGGGQTKKPKAQQPIIRVYSFWAADSVLQQARATGDDSLARELLPALIANYEGWENTRRDPNGLYWQRDLWDGMEETSAFAEFGGKDFCDDNHYRVTINSSMGADAMAIASLAKRTGDAKTAAIFEKKAAEIIALRDTKLWDPVANFYKVAWRGDVPKTTLDDLRLNTDREQYGYVAWYFDNIMPPPERDIAWRQLADPKGFYAPYGPTTCERRGKYYQITYTGRRYCQWNGPSWPFATSQTLTALANVINHRAPSADTAQFRKDWLKTFDCYVRSHKLRLDDGTLVPWIDENLNPYTGDWLAATRHRNNPSGRVPPLHHKDYNHSSFGDIVITALVGLRPAEDDAFTVNPIIPETWDWFCLEDVPYHGKLLTVLYDKTGDKYNRGPGLRVFANGKEIAAGKLGEPLQVYLRSDD